MLTSKQERANILYRSKDAQENSEQETLRPGYFFSFSKCRTAGRHAGDHHGNPFPFRVLCASTSKDIYRHVILNVNSFFAQLLQLINSFYLAKLKYFSFYASYEDDINIFRHHFSSQLSVTIVGHDVIETTCGLNNLILSSRSILHVGRYP